MSRDEMIAFIRKNPNVKIMHKMFADFEYIVQKEDSNMYDENRYLLRIGIQIMMVLENELGIVGKLAEV